MQSIFQVLVFFSFLVSVFAAINGDLISNLPGLSSNDTGFAMYSGYITVASSRHYHYWFVESSSTSASVPVILWLNGGPGCSSLLGLLEENGPFSPDENGNLIPNPYSWNTFAHVLYLESPAGVGFSYCDGDCPGFDDNLTATDNYQVLVQWFQGFAEYSSNDFYIMGESYGGHYVPTLVNQIYQNTPKNPHAAPQRNFKGFAAGNPLTDQGYDITSNYLTTYMQTHGMISLDDNNSGDATGNYNPYDILVDVCDSERLRNYIRFPHPINNMQGGGMPNAKRFVPNPPACIDNFVSNYLNSAAVQSAIHVESTNWENCGGPDYTFSTDSMIPLYKTFIQNTKYKILVYSGDADTVLNFIATERWVLDLKLPVLQPWGPWNYNRIGGDQQLGGWTILFRGLTFATIKGAGHEVPWWQPAPALQLISSFVRS